MSVDLDDILLFGVETGHRKNLSYLGKDTDHVPDKKLLAEVCAQ